MSVSSVTTTTPPRLNRWLILFIVLVAAEVGLFFLRFLPMSNLDYWLGLLLPANEKWSWYLTRSSGTIGYVTLSLSTIWGLLLSTKIVKEWVSPAVALAMHKSLTWIAIGLSAFHAFVLLFDQYYTYTVANLLVPFTGPYAPLWVGIGIINFYLMVLIAGSFYVRSYIGIKNWRRLHYLAFASFIMITLHGWMAGSDSAQLKALYLVSGNLVLFLTLYRILDAVQSKRAKRRQSSKQRLVHA